ncbi:MAG: hypothetical protein BJ554DRAFT_6790 [Olpidium bornovanus]|uniref:Uncharacterized protein n=1 Tax=Olpidium bornovanus TaxID=278681 RepID=A0A8H8DJY9_9FUNG|nr:MAG: hypothetical protein BJ554DRAFT_6790 [Olpidium bornovanus]
MIRSASTEDVDFLVGVLCRTLCPDLVGVPQLQDAVARELGTFPLGDLDQFSVYPALAELVQNVARSLFRAPPGAAADAKGLDPPPPAGGGPRAESESGRSAAAGSDAGAAGGSSGGGGARRRRSVAGDDLSKISVDAEAPATGLPTPPRSDPAADAGGEPPASPPLSSTIPADATAGRSDTASERSETSAAAALPISVVGGAPGAPTAQRSVRPSESRPERRRPQTHGPRSPSGGEGRSRAAPPSGRPGSADPPASAARNKRGRQPAPASSSDDEPGGGRDSRRASLSSEATSAPGPAAARARPELAAAAASLAPHASHGAPHPTGLRRRLHAVEWYAAELLKAAGKSRRFADETARIANCALPSSIDVLDPDGTVPVPDIEILERPHAQVAFGSSGSNSPGCQRLALEMVPQPERDAVDALLLLSEGSKRVRLDG